MLLRGTCTMVNGDLGKGLLPPSMVLWLLHVLICASVLLAFTVPAWAQQHKRKSSAHSATRTGNAPSNAYLENLRQKKQFDVLESTLRTAATRFPTMVRWQALLSVALLDQQKVSQAKEVLVLCTRQFPDSAIVWQLLGNVYQKQRAIDSAILCYERSLLLGPLTTTIGEPLAQCYIEQQQFTTAWQLLERVVEIEPDNELLLRMFANALVADSNYAHAIEVLQHLTSRAPQNVEYASALAFCYQRLDNWKQALDELNRALALSPKNTQLLHNIAVIRLQQAQFDEAIATLRTIRALRPTDVEVKAQLATALLQAGFIEEAVEEYKRIALQHYPSAAKAYDAIGTSYRTANNKDLSIQAHKQAISIDPSTAVYHANYINTLLWAQEQQRALTIAQQALLLFPTDADVLQASGFAFIANGLIDQANGCCKKLDTVNPTFAAALRERMKY
jgi:tetratricopeptide (TPR) repeat protein